MIVYHRGVEDAEFFKKIVLDDCICMQELL